MVIHRDLKSHNILVTDDFCLKVADFGLTVIRDKHARGTTSATDSIDLVSPVSDKGKPKMSVFPTKKGKMRVSLLRKSGSIGTMLEKYEADSGGHYGIRGTPQWMAPEVMEGQRYNGKVDVYSFGIMLTEIFTRKMPYEDKYEGLDFVDAVMEEGVIPTIPSWLLGKRHNIAALASHQDEEGLAIIKALSDLILRCLNRDSRMRPEFNEILTILDPFAQLNDTQVYHMYIYVLLPPRNYDSNSMCP
jgi:serine/threonine protein kinase